ncbi:hypothetical protein [Galbibacter sp.]|nr:hypothetical protein [Galbibacter sp.]HLV63650.1 hypothetical protein [Galbibacter sp.]
MAIGYFLVTALKAKNVDFITVLEAIFNVLNMTSFLIYTKGRLA